MFAFRNLLSLLNQEAPLRFYSSHPEKRSRGIETDGPVKRGGSYSLASKLAEYKSIKDALENTPLGARPVLSGRSRKYLKPSGAKREGIIGPLKEIPGFEIKTIHASELELTPVAKPQPPVPSLSYGLERVLFNPGVYHLRDPRSRVFNFDPYLQSIMPVSEFDFTALKQYITSSKDDALLSTAKEEKKKYTGSTSSMTSALSHFHYLLSQWREINTGTLSQNFPVEFKTFTQLQRAPSAVFLKWKDGTYAIDADKEFDTANILSMLGKSMEKLLTLPTEEFEKYRKQNSDQITEEVRNETESFNYTTIGDFLLRSQLDAYDSRLPGTGMFDLKTRAVVSIRMDTSMYEHGSGYEIRKRYGEWESFEREYYDMIRSAFLKYSLQVRMGRMDGIFVAFHNTERIFGFQYISLPEMDYALHGTEDTTIGDSEFKLSLELLNKVLDRATAKYPEKSLRLHFETRNVQTPFMYIFAEPVEEEQIQEIQESSKAVVEEFERRVLGLHKTEEEEKKAEWDSLRAKVEASIERDELDIQELRSIAETVIEDSEIFGSDSVSVEEKEKLISELLESADFGENEEAGHMEGVDRGNFGEDGIDGASAASEGEDVDEEEVDIAEEDEELDNDSNGPEQADAEDTLEQISTNEASELQEVRRSRNLVDLESTETVEEELQNKASEDADNIEDGDSVGTDNTELIEEEFVADEIAEEDETPDSTDVEEPTATEAEDVTEEVPSAEEENTLAGQEISSTEPPTSPPENLPEVLAMTLTIRNKVNGKYVDRPKYLGLGDKWTVEYSLTDVAPERTRTLYDACKRRRASALSNARQKENNAWNNRYLEKLRRLSQKGREWRESQDEIDETEPLKVLDVRDGKKLDKKRTGVWSEEKEE